MGMIFTKAVDSKIIGATTKSLNQAGSRLFVQNPRFTITLPKQFKEPNLHIFVTQLKLVLGLGYKSCPWYKNKYGTVSDFYVDVCTRGNPLMSLAGGLPCFMINRNEDNSEAAGRGKGD
jgi:hypothetical protein